MPQLQTIQVFMSYSRRDKDVMWRVVKFLRNQGINVWVDNEKLIPGTPIWEEEIEKAIKSASVIVVVMSPDSKNSEWVRREISLADQEHKNILPILVRGDEDSSITLRLVTRQYVDMRQNEEAGLNSLHSALSQYLDGLEVQPEEIVGKEAKKEFIDKPISEKVARHESASPKVEKAHPLPISQTLLWFTTGWIFAGFIAGFIYSSSNIAGDGITGEYISGIIGFAIGGALGGFIISMALRSKATPADQKNTFRITLAWAIGSAIGWAIGRYMTEASGAGIGMAIFPLIGLAGAFGIDYVFSNWKSTAAITLTWAISSAIGWAISRRFLIDTLHADKATSWAIGTAIAWAIGGFVMGWQLLKNKDNG